MGAGAVVTATLNLNGQHTLAITGGCLAGRGQGVGWDIGGANAGAGHEAGSDGGGGGGGSEIGDPVVGATWLVAGGGGGPGGPDVANAPGGGGGNAGLGWNSAGAGPGGPGSGDNPPDGGAGAANTQNGQPVNFGDSPAEVSFAGGGAGAGGGGMQGGQGGDTINDFGGGGGGGAGSSVFDPNHAVNPTVATSSTVNTNGFVTIVPESVGQTSGASPRAIGGARAHALGRAGAGSGSLAVSARVIGNDTRSHRSAVFAVRVLCQAGGHDIKLPGGLSSIFGLVAGRPRTIGPLPAGTQCRSDEINSRGATGVTIRTARDRDDGAAWGRRRADRRRGTARLEGDRAVRR